MRDRRTNAALLAAAAMIALIACDRKSEPPKAPDPGSGDDVSLVREETLQEQDEAMGKAGRLADFAAIATAAAADSARPEADRADDERRKPVEALAFMEVQPGMTVFEIEAGGGWYTELLSHAVGSTGSVIMQNPAGFQSFVGDKIAERLKDGRLPNVRQSISNFDALESADGSVDLVTWVQGPHELYYKPKEGPLGDPAKSYAEIARILKPGGAFVVIDHSAESGAPETTGDTLHRIDKIIVMQMADQSGFTLVGESDFLGNPEDPLTVGVFDPSIRGHTDQFALRFRKD